MRRKILYAAMTGGFGSLAQVLPILERLDPAKYRIVCSIAHGAAHAVQRLGYELIPYPDVGKPDPVLVTPPGREWRDLDQYWGRFGFGDPKYFASLVEARLRIVERLKPDLLLTQFCPPTEIIARITKIPLICVTQSCWHPAGKSVCWWNDLGPGDYVKVTPVVNDILTHHGADPIGRMTELNRGDLTLIPSFPEFDPIDDPSVHYIGPSPWASAAFIEPSLSALDDLQDWRSPMHDGPGFEAIRRSRSSRPLVVVYTGHLHDSGGRSGILILEKASKALSDTEIDVLITTGLGQPPAAGIVDAPNVQVREWVDLKPLLERCALFIHHGGHGSCMAGIMAGAVALVIPTFQEREFNARQLKSLGLGSFVLPDPVTPEELRRIVRAGLHDPEITRNLRRWQDELARRAYGGAARAAMLIESAF